MMMDTAATDGNNDTSSTIMIGGGGGMMSDMIATAVTTTMTMMMTNLTAAASLTDDMVIDNTTTFAAELGNTSLSTNATHGAMIAVAATTQMSWSSAMGGITSGFLLLIGSSLGGRYMARYLLYKRVHMRHRWIQWFMILWNRIPFIISRRVDWLLRQAWCRLQVQFIQLWLWCLLCLWRYGRYVYHRLWCCYHHHHHHLASWPAGRIATPIVLNRTMSVVALILFWLLLSWVYQLSTYGMRARYVAFPLWVAIVVWGYIQVPIFFWLFLSNTLIQCGIVRAMAHRPNDGGAGRFHPRDPIADMLADDMTTRPADVTQSLDTIELALHAKYRSKARHHYHGPQSQPNQPAVVGHLAADLWRSSQLLVANEIITAINTSLLSSSSTTTTTSKVVPMDVALVIVQYYWYDDRYPMDLIHDDVITRLLCDLWINCNRIHTISQYSRYQSITAPLRLGYDNDQSPLIRIPVIYTPSAQVDDQWDANTDAWFATHQREGCYQLDTRDLCRHEITNLYYHWQLLTHADDILRLPPYHWHQWWMMNALRWDRDRYHTERLALPSPPPPAPAPAPVNVPTPAVPIRVRLQKLLTGVVAILQWLSSCRWRHVVYWWRTVHHRFALPSIFFYDDQDPVIRTHHGLAPILLEQSQKPPPPSSSSSSGDDNNDPNHNDHDEPVRWSLIVRLSLQITHGHTYTTHQFHALEPRQSQPAVAARRSPRGGGYDRRHRRHWYRRDGRHDDDDSDDDKEGHHHHHCAHCNEERLNPPPPQPPLVPSSSPPIASSASSSSQRDEPQHQQWWSSQRQPRRMPKGLQRLLAARR